MKYPSLTFLFGCAAMLAGGSLAAVIHGNGPGQSVAGLIGTAIGWFVWAVIILVPTLLKWRRYLRNKPERSKNLE